jgi:hypothetical protein
MDIEILLVRGCSTGVAARRSPPVGRRPYPSAKDGYGRRKPVTAVSGPCGRCSSVDEVVGELLDLDVREPGLAEHLAGLLLAPHRAEARAALRERDRHAVHGGDGVHERAQQVVDVVVDVARAGDVLHQVDAVGAQGLGDPRQHRRGLAWSWITSKVVTRS